MPIDVGLLTEPEKAWLNAYHARVREVVAPQVDEATRAWLDRGDARDLERSRRLCRESTESTRVHSGVDRFDADGIGIFARESTNPPTPLPPRKTTLSKVPRRLSAGSRRPLPNGS